jgi:hypothetical protein
MSTCGWLALGQDTMSELSNMSTCDWLALGQDNIVANQSQVDMLLNSDIVSWSTANQSQVDMLLN